MQRGGNSKQDNKGSIFKIKGRGTTNSKRTLRTQDWPMFSSEQKRNKLGRNWEDPRGTSPDSGTGRYFRVTNHTARVVAAGELHRRQTRTQGGRYRSSSAWGAWEGLSRGPGIPSVPLQAFCARFNSQFRLLFSNSVVWKFFSSQENTIKLRSQRLLTGERFQAKTTPSRCFARSGRGDF